MALRQFLPEGCSYIGCDLASREPRTIVCDFNADEYPNTDADVTTMLGLLEYISDLGAFTAKVRTSRVIFSYHPVDAPDRRADGRWLNAFGEDDLLRHFARFVLLDRLTLSRGQRLYHFRASNSV